MLLEKFKSLKQLNKLTALLAFNVSFGNERVVITKGGLSETQTFIKLIQRFRVSNTSYEAQANVIYAVSGQKSSAKSSGQKPPSHKPPVKKPPRNKSPPEQNAPRTKSPQKTISLPNQLAPHSNLPLKPIFPNKKEFQSLKSDWV